MKLSHTLLAATALAVVSMAPAGASAQSAALVQTPIATGHCLSYGSTTNHVVDSGFGCDSTGLTVQDGSHGIILLGASDLLHPSSAAILNSTPGQPTYLGKGVATSSTDVADEFFERYANYTGGTSGFVNGAVRILDNVSAGATAFEWGLTSIMDNSSSQADASENVAIYAQAHKRNGGGTWALTAELQDHNADPNSPSVTFEHDLQVKGTDIHSARVIDDLWGKSDDGNPATVTYGYRLNTDTHTTITNGITTYGATIGNAAIALGTGQKLCFDGVTCSNYLTQSSSQLHLWAGGADGMQVGALGTNVTALNATAGQISLPATQKLCFDGTSCTYDLKLSGSNLQVNTPSGTAAQFTALTSNLLATTATTMDAATRVSVPTHNKFCLDGTTCAAYITFDGSNIDFYTSNTLRASINATGHISAAAGYDIGTTAGQNCLATGYHATSGGIVVTC